MKPILRKQAGTVNPFLNFRNSFLKFRILKQETRVILLDNHEPERKDEEMKHNLYKTISATALALGCLTLTLTACMSDTQQNAAAEATEAVTEEAAAEAAETVTAEAAAEVAEAVTAEDATGAAEAATVEAPAQTDMAAAKDITAETASLAMPVEMNTEVPAPPQEGEEMPNMPIENGQPGGLPDAAIAPNGNVRMLVTFKEGVSVEDGLAIISNEILNGAACDVNRRDDAAREASITVTQEQAELMNTCTVIESAKAQMQMPMH